MTTWILSLPINAILVYWGTFINKMLLKFSFLKSLTPLLCCHYTLMTVPIVQLFQELRGLRLFQPFVLWFIIICFMTNSLLSSPNLTHKISFWLPFRLHFDLNLWIWNVLFQIYFTRFLTISFFNWGRFRSKRYCTSSCIFLIYRNLLNFLNLILKTVAQHHQTAIFFHFFCRFLLWKLIWGSLDDLISWEMVWSFWRLSSFLFIWLLTFNYYIEQRLSQNWIILFMFIQRNKLQIFVVKVVVWYQFSSRFWKFRAKFWMICILLVFIMSY